MLKELYIKNYALIDELTIRFSEQLTVLSGETGAGKSIIVGALGLILGEKGRTSMIRSGRDMCIVEGRFSVEKGHPVHRLLESKGIEEGGDEGELVLRRILTLDGTSKSFVNGLQVTVRDLAEITDQIIDIHGQHEHQSLLNVKNHILLLDQYGHLEEDLARYRQYYRKVSELRSRIEELTLDEREKERRIDILKYSINEIERAKLREGEDEELEQEYRVLKHYEDIVSSVSAAYNLLSLQEASTLGMLESAIAELEKIGNIAPDIEKLLGDLNSAKLLLDDCAHTLQHYVEGIEYEPGKIDRILARIELIKSLKKKYGDTIGEVLAYRRRCEVELDGLISNEKTIKELELQADEALEKAGRFAVELSARRRVAARTLEESIMKELAFLNLGKSRFQVNITYRESDDGPVIIDGKRYALTPSGLDHVEFLISTNVGEPLLPLKSVASGGELSRIMLAIKSVLGTVDPIQTFVFDEIDAGIGGRVGWAVGNRLKELAKLKQILCITHLAQIAARGTLNIRVEKVNRDGRAVTEVQTLEGNQKVEEIARMISGKTISEAALKQAQEMITEG